MKSVLLVLAFLLAALDGDLVVQGTRVKTLDPAGRISVQAVVENPGAAAVGGQVTFVLTPTGGAALNLQQRVPPVPAGGRVTVRVTTHLFAPARLDSTGSTFQARLEQGKVVTWSVATRIATDALPAPPVAPQPAKAPGVLRVASQRFRNGGAGGEIRFLATVRNYGETPATGTVELTLRDASRGDVRTASARVEDVAPGEERPVEIRTGLFSPNTVDSDQSLLQVEFTQILAPAYQRWEYNPVIDSYAWVTVPAQVQRFEGTYAVEVQVR